MKGFVLVLLTLLSLQNYGQCTECTSFDEALKDPEKVESLMINSWQHNVTLDSIPVSIAELVNIEVVYLSDHNISEIPTSIGKLKKLKELSFAGCQLKELPEEIYGLKNLRELILLNNQFSDEYIAEVKKRVKAEMPKTKVLISRDE